MFYSRAKAWAVKRLLFLLYLFPFFASPVPAENTHSMPFGFIKLELPGGSTNSRILASVPFFPLDPSVSGVFPDRFASGNEVERIITWNVDEQRFITATRGSATNAAEWISEQGLPSELTIYPGEGFWLEVESERQLPDIAVFAWGQWILDPSVSLRLAPGMSMISYPFSSTRLIAECDLPLDGADADTITRYSDNQYWHAVNVSADSRTPVFHWQSTSGELGGPAMFELGAGYWYGRNAAHTNELTWTEQRPYQDLFPVSGPPFVIDMRPGRAGNTMTLTIACSGAEHERIDILYKDLEPTNRFTVLGGWQPAVRDISTPTVTNGASIITWTDSGSATRPKVDGVFCRTYVIIRADLAEGRDSDLDGVSNTDEIFVIGTDPAISNNFSSGQLSLLGNTNDVSPAQSGAGPQNVIYIDAARGDDANSGYSPTASKKTIAGGLAIARDGDTIIIMEGLYAGETMDLRGKAVTVVIQGKVDLGRRTWNPPGN